MTSITYLKYLTVGILATCAAPCAFAQFRLPNPKDLGIPIPKPQAIVDTVLPPFEQRVGNYNEEFKKLREELEQNYYTLHDGAVTRIQVAFVPVISSYKNGVSSVKNSLPEVQTVKLKMSEKVDVAQAPTKTSLDLAAHDMAESTGTFKDELAALMQMLQSLGSELTDEQKAQLVRANSRFSSNMEVIAQDWKSFGKEGSDLIKDAKAKKKQLNDQYYKSVVSALASKAASGTVLQAVQQGKFDGDQVLRALGYSTLSEAPQAVQVWIENGKFWAGLPPIQEKFDQSFKTIEDNIASARKLGKEADDHISDIRKATNNPELKNAIAEMERNHKDAERSGTIEI